MMRQAILFTALALLFGNSTAMGYNSSQADSLKQRLDSLLPGPQKVYLLKEIAWALKSDRPVTAHRYADEALQLAETLKYERGIADARHTKGMIFWYQGEYHKASRLFFDALAIRENLNDSLGLSRSFNNIGNVYFRQKNFEQALYYYDRSLKIRHLLQDSIGLAYSLVSIAEVKTEQEQDEEALQFFGQALAIAQAIGHEGGRAFTHEKMGRFLQNRGQLEKARREFATALAITRQSRDKNKAARNLLHLGSVFLQQGDPQSAAFRLHQALQASEEIKARGLQAEALQLLSIAHAQQGRYDSAYLFQNRYNQLYIDVINSERERAILDIQEQYQSEKQRADLLEAERRASRTQKLFFISLLLALLLLAIIMISRYRMQIRMNDMLQEKNREIARQNQSLTQSNRALEQFAYVVSHDLREPLRTIGSFSTLLARRYREKLDSNGKDFIEYIVNGTEQMNRLLDGLLAYARLSDMREFTPEAVDLNDVLRQVKYALKTEIDKKHVHISSDELPTLMSEPTQMYQLLQNLISNSIKFNDKAEARIRIRYRKNGEGHHFSVTDNGIGIDTPYFDKIFLMFQRLEKQQFPGTGIGLAICEKVIERHGGSIWVESEKGQGSTFHFTIPQY